MKKQNTKNSYYDSLKWSHIRDLIHKRDKNCQRCESVDNLNVHHIIYDNFGNEKDHLEDLVLLCRKCHKTLHNKYSVDKFPGRQRYWISYLKKIKQFNEENTEITSRSSDNINDLLWL